MHLFSRYQAVWSAFSFPKAWYWQNQSSLTTLLNGSLSFLPFLSSYFSCLFRNRLVQIYRGEKRSSSKLPLINLYLNSCTYMPNIPVNRIHATMLLSSVRCPKETPWPSSCTEIFPRLPLYYSPRIIKWTTLLYNIYDILYYIYFIIYNIE